MLLSPEPSLPIGEVIAANTSQFTAQCIDVPRHDRVSELPDPPAFGAFVRIGGEGVGEADDRSVLPDDFDPFEAPAALPMPPGDDSAAVLYAVVFHAEIGALEAGRPLTAFGLDEESLRREQPQIFELLATRFSAVLIAYASDSSGADLRPHLPPRPPRPHARVFAATDNETRQLTERLDYLRPLLSGSSGSAASYPADELVAALLRRAWRAHWGDESFLLRAGRELAALLPTEYDRLRAIVKRIIG
jgi:hypothetical protein